MSKTNVKKGFMTLNQLEGPGNGNKKIVIALLALAVIICFFNPQWFNNQNTKKISAEQSAPSLEEILKAGVNNLLSFEDYSVVVNACNSGEGDHNACDFLVRYHKQHSIVNGEIEPGSVSDATYAFFLRMGIKKPSDLYSLGKKSAEEKAKKIKTVIYKTSEGSMRTVYSKRILEEFEEVVEHANFPIKEWGEK